MRMWPFCSVGGAARFHANTLREASEKCYECATKLREFLVFPSKKIASLNRGHVRPKCKIGHCTLFWPTLMGNCGRSPIPNLTLLWQLRNASCFLGISRFPFFPPGKCNAMLLDHLSAYVLEMLCRWRQFVVFTASWLVNCTWHQDIWYLILEWQFWSGNVVEIVAIWNI